MHKPLFLIIFFSISAELQAGAVSESPEYSAEEKRVVLQYMDEPEFYNQEAEATTSPPPAAPTIQGSRSVADDAYRNKDYKTAKKHYEALAKEGDGEASAIVGTMYQDGLGTDKDLSKARAWYKKADDEDDSWGVPLAEALEKDSMTAEDIAKSEEIYKELNTNKPLELDPPKNSVANSITASTKTSHRTASKRQSTKVQNSFDISSQVKITPERYRRNANNQQSKKTNFDHYKPEKYTR